MDREWEEESQWKVPGKTGAELSGQLHGQPRGGRAAFTPSKEKMGVKKKFSSLKLPLFYLKENNSLFYHLEIAPAYPVRVSPSRFSLYTF